MLRKHRALRSAALLGPSALEGPQGSAEAGATYLLKKRDSAKARSALRLWQPSHIDHVIAPGGSMRLLGDHRDLGRREFANWLTSY